LRLGVIVSINIGSLDSSGGVWGDGEPLKSRPRSENFHTAGVAEVTRITKKQVMHSDEDEVAGTGLR
jgi:hypothetical protein